MTKKAKTTTKKPAPKAKPAAVVSNYDDTPKTNGANWLAQKAMLTSLTICRWEAHAFDKKVTQEVNDSHNATDDAGRYNKRLIDKVSVQPLSRVINEARTYHARMTAPWLDHADSRILPAGLYVQYTTQMNRFREAFEAAVEAFIVAYPEAVERRRKAINGLFNEDDYPSVAKLRSCFSFDVTIMPCPDAGDFRVALADEHAADIKRDIEDRMNTAMSNAMHEPLRRIVDVVGHMAERLKAYKPSTGKGDKAEGVFRDGTVENIRDLVALLPAFNLANDPNLTAITARIEKELCATDAKDLRGDDVQRAAVATSAEDILAQVSKYM